MSKGWKTLIATLAVPLALIASYFAMLAVSVWDHGYSWEEMDWRQRGYTTIADFFAAADIGKRDIEVDGKTCAEYYDYKDGRRVKLMCPPH
jgi:hypothetical protein